MSAQKDLDLVSGPKNSQGFILLELLLSMSLILGVWMTTIGAYQRLALSLVKQEDVMSKIRREGDAFEAQEHSRLNHHISKKSLGDDSTRMSSRNRSVRNFAQPVIKNKR